MNFVIKSSLQDIALIKVAAILWNQHDIKSLVVEFSNSPLFSKVDKEHFLPPISLSQRRKNWQKIEDKVIEKVSQLAKLASLKEKILDCIQVVGFQILRWMEYHRRTCRLDLDLRKEFSWTSQGTIDKKKTAEALIRDESIDISTRYKLACIYCLEDDIPKLWNRIPVSDRDIFYCEENPSMILQHKLVVFWTYTLKGEVNKIGEVTGRSLDQRCSPNRYAFRCAAISGNKIATEYFFQKLRNKNLIVRTILYLVERCDRDRRRAEPPVEYSTEVVCFLLSQMESNRQIEVLKMRPFEVVRCFLNWPFQKFFLEVASHVWNCLHDLKPYHLFKLILLKIIFDYKDYNYERMFEETWQQQSNAHKIKIITDSSIAGLVSTILLIEDNRKVGIFKSIFQDPTLVDKHELIFSERAQYICEDLIEEGQWELIRFFVQLYITSKDEMIDFKQKIEECMQAKLSIFSGNKYVDIKNKCDEFSRILDDFIHEYDKRKNEGDNNPSKKFCTHCAKEI